MRNASTQLAHFNVNVYLVISTIMFLESAMVEHFVYLLLFFTYLLLLVYELIMLIMYMLFFNYQLKSRPLSQVRLIFEKQIGLYFYLGLCFCKTRQLFYSYILIKLNKICKTR